MTSDFVTTPTMETRTCQRCGRPFIPAYCFSNHCPPCAQVRADEHDQRMREEHARIEAETRLQRWEELCPPLYRESDLDRLPAAALQAVADYQFGAKGLGFVGVSGLGKTRTMMLLCRRLITVSLELVCASPGVKTVDDPPAKLLGFLARHPAGVSARDVLRARLAPDSSTATELLEGFARTGHLDRREDRPAASGKAVVTYRLATTEPCHQ